MKKQIDEKSPEFLYLVNSIFEYDPISGGLILKKRRTRAPLGSRAGCLIKRGYYSVRVNRKTYLVHRLTWLVYYGVWPEKNLDHINGNTLDNRIENLREVTVRENSQNRREHRSGRLVGARYHKRNKKWTSGIVINGKVKHLGTFLSEQEAHEAYVNKLNEIKLEKVMEELKNGIL